MTTDEVIACLEGMTEDQRHHSRVFRVALSRIMPKDYETVAQPIADKIEDPDVRKVAQYCIDLGIATREQARATK
jgi:hypothetical protein